MQSQRIPRIFLIPGFLWDFCGIPQNKNERDFFGIRLEKILNPGDWGFCRRDFLGEKNPKSRG